MSNFEYSFYDNITIYLPFISSCASCIDYRNKKSWRSDNYCGTNYPFIDGRVSECNPSSRGLFNDGPCCSQIGVCGTTENHCQCRTCTDYREPCHDDLGFELCLKESWKCTDPVFRLQCKNTCNDCKQMILESCFGTKKCYKKGDIAHSEVFHSPLECQKFCQRTHGCSRWTFKEGTCYLKDKEAHEYWCNKEISGPEYCPLERSGEKNIPLKVTFINLHEIAIDIYEIDGNFKELGPHPLQPGTGTEKRWTNSHLQQVFIFKESNTNLTVRAHHEEKKISSSVFEGSAFGEGDEMVIKIYGYEDCSEYNVQYGDTHLSEHGHSTNSSEECHQLCQRMLGCLFWTFTSENRRCYPKGGNFTATQCTNCVSGKAYCRTECFQAGIKYTGQILSSGTVESKHECQRQCQLIRQGAITDLVA